MTRFLLVCLGGAAGTGARYLVAVGMARWLGGVFPFGTLTVNVVGSFLIGLLAEAAAAGAISADVRLVAVTGVLGGFTTYSSFNNEALTYLQRGPWPTGLAYLGTTLLGCLAAGMLGVAAGRWVTGA